MRLRPAGATRSGRRSGCEAAGAEAELRRAGSQNDVVRMPSVEDVMCGRFILQAALIPSFSELLNSI